ncbi:protein LONGIFOLIA 1 [Humulus lupulus]|uniref:protein LONGIFOLIA 1 n=1 Tax=Humulus lupulus TaxID=3486 RepID=UPI002B413788|nr:protein LONGIFOLIA 1 [Humulus lupulus]XP_062116736.1 protein LONGIFOLIA 1 [Humulus lupulus]XP_062116737.1 protein LONGIFOLIA 1 [Humulus lupulus]
MAAKILHSLADENPDLQKQIGCMTGIFQIFDRHPVLTGKRISHKRFPPPGTSSFSNINLERQSNNLHYQQTSGEVNSNKSVNEKQRFSTESSRASVSSSCSSVSSLDGNKTAQQEVFSFDRIIIPETSSKDPVRNQSSISPRLGRHSLDLRDVVKDSMYREARGLSVKTATKEEAAGGHGVKHRDSPRPLQLSKHVDESNGVGISGKQNTPVDLKESLRVLAKLREAPWYYNDAREDPGSSNESKDGSWHSISRDARRFSCDGRETNRLSFESRDSFKSTAKLKESPRLSLDSRECSMRGSNLSKIAKSCRMLNENDPSLPESSGTQNRPPSVVAKLMGLDALPDSTSAGDGQLGLIKTFPIQDGDSSTRSPTTNNLNRPIRLPNSPRNLLKEPSSPQWNNSDFVMKPISSSRFPIEPAPWRMQDGNKGSQKTSSRPVKVPARTSNSFPSVYSEIEKRLKDLEFKQSGKDLRALKQILEAMQSKGLLDTRKEEPDSNFGAAGCHEHVSYNLNQRSADQRYSQSNHLNGFSLRGPGSSRTFESPIVIMKPAKLVEKSVTSTSSAVSVDGHSEIHKSHNGGAVDGKKVPNNSRTAPKFSRRDAAVNSVDKRGGARNTKSAQSRSQQLSMQNTATNTVKSSASVSPRLQQKKLEMEKRSRPPTPPSNSNKPRRQTNRQSTDTGSPGGRARPKYNNSQQCDDQLSEISNESKSLSCQGDNISLHSEDNMLLDLKTDVEVTSVLLSTDMNCSLSPSMKVAKYLESGSIQKRATPRLDEEESFAELPTVAPEHPSPVSVLDTSAYKDDAPSPVRQIPTVLRGDKAEDSNEMKNLDQDQWSSPDKSTGSGLTSEINRKKLENIENLVQKLRRLNSSHDEARTDYIASLCENTNPDHRYVSEILLASGLLLRDLGSGLTTLHLHPSGHPINPELFFVLEQTKASSLQSKEECSLVNAVNVKSDKEKLHRKLIFDAVNEILVGKLSLVGESCKPWLRTKKLAKKTLNAQKLLKELCFEIEQFQTKKLDFSLEGEDDGLKTILWEDVMHRSENWTDFSGDISGAVLDVERSIFKDLVDEVIKGEAANLRAKPGRRRRKLFAK